MARRWLWMHNFIQKFAASFFSIPLLSCSFLFRAVLFCSFLLFACFACCCCCLCIFHRGTHTKIQGLILLALHAHNPIYVETSQPISPSLVLNMLGQGVLPNLVYSRAYKKENNNNNIQQLPTMPYVRAQVRLRVRVRIMVRVRVRVGVRMKKNGVRVRFDSSRLGQPRGQFIWSRGLR